MCWIDIYHIVCKRFYGRIVFVVTGLYLVTIAVKLKRLHIVISERKSCCQNRLNSPVNSQTHLFISAFHQRTCIWLLWKHPEAPLKDVLLIFHPYYYNINLPAKNILSISWPREEAETESTPLLVPSPSARCRPHRRRRLFYFPVCLCCQKKMKCDVHLMR